MILSSIVETASCAGASADADAVEAGSKLSLGVVLSLLGVGCVFD